MAKLDLSKEIDAMSNEEFAAWMESSAAREAFAYNSRGAGLMSEPEDQWYTVTEKGLDDPIATAQSEAMRNAEDWCRKNPERRLTREQWKADRLQEYQRDDS
jgi:hypothetical protein